MNERERYEAEKAARAARFEEIEAAGIGALEKIEGTSRVEVGAKPLTNADIKAIGLMQTDPEVFRVLVRRLAKPDESIAEASRKLALSRQALYRALETAKRHGLSTSMARTLDVAA